MNTFQRLFAITTAMTLCVSSLSLRAEEGDCYQECCYRKIRPEWAVGGLAVAAILAVCLQNNGSGHDH